MSSSTTATTISVQCPCGKKLKAPATAVGRKAKCPSCGNVMTVTAPPATSAPAPASAPPSPVSLTKSPKSSSTSPAPAHAAAADPYDPMYDLAEQAHASAASPAASAPLAPPVCPNCRSNMMVGAILCTACGYDTRTGQTLSTSLATAAPSRGPSIPLPPGRRSAAAATTVDTGERAAYIRGTIISGIAALIGAFVWFAIAKGTQREIGWIAWGVGFLAGLGMMIGANGNSVTAGMIAAGMAVGGILLGKVMVFTFVVMPLFNSMLDKTLGGISDADKLEVWMTNQQLEKKKLDVESASDAQRAVANGEAKKLIAKMDAKTKQAEMKKANDNFTRIMGEAADEIPKGRLFASTMFAPMDVLFFILAIASAFKVATFGGESD